MNLVGKVSGMISQGMYSVATPFHPFGGAVDIIVVKQEDGTFRSTPWYVRFGKFQGVLKGAEKLVRIEVNGVEADFAMHLDNSGEAYFVKEVDHDKDDDDCREHVREEIKSDLKEHNLLGQDSNEFDLDVRDERVTLGMERLERVESDANRIFYEFEDEISSAEGSVDYSEYGSSRYDNLESVERALESQSSSSEVVLVSIDGHILTAPLSSSERDAVDVEQSTAQFHLGPGEVTEGYNRDESTWNPDYMDDLESSSCKVTTENLGDSNKATLVSEEHQVTSTSSGLNRDMVFKSCLELQELAVDLTKANKGTDTENQHDKTEEEESKANKGTGTEDQHDKAGEDGFELKDNKGTTEDQHDKAEEDNLELKGNRRTNTEDQHDKAEEENLELKANTGTDTVDQDDKTEEDNLGISAHEDKIHENKSSADTYGTNDQLNKTEVQCDNNEGENVEISTHEDEIHENEFNANTGGIVDQDDNTRQQRDRTEEETLEISAQENEIHEDELNVHTDDTDSKRVPFVSNGEAVERRTEVDVAVERMDSGEKAPASEDECAKSEHAEEPAHGASDEDLKSDLLTKVEISLCRNLLQAGMGSNAAAEAFETNRVSPEEFKLSATSIMKNENLIVRLKGRYYLPWEKAAHLIVGTVAFGLDLPIDDIIPVEQDPPEGAKEDDPGMDTTPSRRWRLWSIPFRRVKTLEHTGSNSSTEEVFVDSESIVSTSPNAQNESPRKQIVRTNVPTTEQIESLNLQEGQNMVNFVFSTRVLGSQKVEAHIYLWKWNTKIVISDVDGTITKSDVLGQFMPLVGKDWTHSGIARLFSAIKENGYQLLFLSARAIVQAYLTKSFLFNLKQDGKSLPTGPVVISPDGLFPSLYREVIRRAPHEFKIACLEDIKALFPPGHNPFYAGFGNRDTDELSYRKIGIPKGKIFIINPKGEVAINHRIEMKSYTSLHTLVHDMFPPTELVEEEDYNAWNYWKMPLPDIDDL